VQEALAAAEERLNGRGRLVVRSSGTEPKLRIMVEAEDEDTMLAVGGELVGRIESALRTRAA
jgi:Phosphomannomutase